MKYINKVSKNVFIYTISNSYLFCADENKKTIEIVVKYNGSEYTANNIEVTKDNFAEPNQRIEFIKTNKEKFISGENKLNCTDLIKEVSEIGKWEGLTEDSKDEFTLGRGHVTDNLKNLLKATIEIDDYIELKYIKTDKKLKNKQLEDAFEKGVIKFFNDSKKKELDTNWARNKIKGLLNLRFKVDVNDDVFIFDKKADKKGIIKESCTLKINFPDSLIEGNPDPKPTDPNNNNSNNSSNSSNNGGNSPENNKKSKSCSGS